MAETVVAEDVAPLLVKDEPDNLGKDLEAEMAVPSAGVNSKGTCWNLFAFLYQRSTYYWIAFIAQFSQVTLQSIGWAVAVAHKEFDEKDADNSYAANLFIMSGTYSFITLLFNMYLIIAQYKDSDVGRTRVTAGKHFAGARFCAFLNLLNLGAILARPVSRHGEQTYSDEIRPIIVPLIVGFVVVSVLANATAAYITSTAAKQARGTDLVPDPDYRVPAWTLSTTEESQGLWRQNAIQLPV